MGGSMNYDEVYRMVARYVPELLHLFADKWSRWPSSPNADGLILALYAKGKWYKAMKCEEQFFECMEAAGRIQDNLKTA
jgi:hypothetical protein